ncbi:metal-dependent phosphohydrolase [Phormidium sp. CLA17]|uniref:DICT sensory domain-containing protein n=1 Tax=Leptolyngbya sp. Cla-17 TaxID=2803751 RepID=UPI001491BC91|nr:DICT sensory domain-containing protein [Leptolyngbya sp. Cla-17]MBM0742616.1 metal-dependent phosphohydrolase [Leptolyngbya sp. Cla-17]
MLEGSILYQLKLAHQSAQGSQRSLNFGVYYKNTLVALCHALEDCILTCSSEPLVITAFQRGKWYLEEADRYAELAERSREVVLMAAPDSGFAEHPTSQRQNVELVSLSADDPVAQEWHLMILAPTYSAMVLCQELSVAEYGKQGVPRVDLERKFYGFWTFEADLVQEAMELAIAHLRTYNPVLADTLTQHIHAIVSTPIEKRDPLESIVSRVVDYLQESHTISTPTHHTFEQPQILDGNLLSNEIQAFLRMAQLTDQADALNPNAAAEVATLVEAMGQFLDLPVWQLNRLKLASLLHRLAPLQSSASMLTPSSLGRYSQDLSTDAPCCPLVPGAQVLRTMPRMRAIATIITHLSEHWDGSGQPGGLVGDEIPLESRMLGLVAAFQQQVADQRARSEGSSLPECLAIALSQCHKEQSRRWDPKLVDTLTLLVSGLQQGLNLPVSMPKISAGLWLLDSHDEALVPRF